MPPYGWSERVEPECTVLRGWDWGIASTTLLHAPVTLPVLAGCLGVLRGLAVWVALSLLVGAGAGWRLIVDARGFVFSWTWFRVPLCRRRLPAGSPFAAEDDPWARGDLAEWVRLGPCGDARAREFGSARNAAGVVAAMHRAVARHAHPPRTGHPYRNARHPGA
jgi:hypothetical protein